VRQLSLRSKFDSPRFFPFHFHPFS
jgi:hypothetical protein